MSVQVNALRARSSSALHLCALALLVCCCLASLASIDGSKQQQQRLAGQEEEERAKQAEKSFQGRDYLFSGQHWLSGSADAAPGPKSPLDNNELDTGDHFKSQSHYVCGRPIAASKRHRQAYGEPTGADQLSALQQPSRPLKYRPTEIRMPRIIGGDETSPGEFPWTASVKLNGQPICGGSLIDNSWILTAAHCVVGYNPKNLTIRLGAYRIKDMSEAQTIDSAVSMFVVHREYSMPRPFSNDIAMLKLLDPIEYNDYIVPICLPTEDAVATGDRPLDYSTGYNVDTLTGAAAAAAAAGASAAAPSALDADLADSSSAIVVSTKMSDSEIAKCFNRLEQNYLSSIGLGAIAEATTELTAQQQQVQTQSQPQNQQHYQHQNQEALIQQLHQQQQQSQHLQQLQHHQYQQQQQHQQYQQHQQHQQHKQYQQHQQYQRVSTARPQLDQLFSYGNLLESLIGGPKGQNASPGQQEGQLDFEPSSSGAHLSKPALVSQQFDATLLSNSHGPSGPLNNIVAPNNYQASYYKLPWSAKNTDETLGGRLEAATGAEVLQARPRAASESIKLSRLPISKELLREIQTVGSNSMPLLNLDFRPGDFMAMASDLTHQNEQPEQHERPSSAHSHATRYSSSGNAAAQQQQQQQPLRFGPSQNAGPALELAELVGPELDQAAEVDPNRKYSGLSGTVVGWGWVRELDSDVDQASNKGFPSVTLQKVRLPILRNSVCEAWFQSQAKKITLLPSQFCAGFSSGGKDACRGDSGGPMIIENGDEPGRYKLIGIVSAGIGCARPSLPGLYTRVASFLPWITAQMRRH